MRIDKEKLEKLSALPDNELWCELRRIAGSYGFKLPEATPSGADMQKLRSVACDTSKINIGDAMKILNDMKKRQSK